MKPISCPAWFAWLVSLYPAEFRETFGPEMLAVFTAKLTAARNAVNSGIKSPQNRGRNVHFLLGKMSSEFP